MRVRNLTESRIEFVFGQVNDQLKGELKDFWRQHGTDYLEELRSFRIASRNGRGVVEQMDLLRKPILRKPAAISRDQSGAINGIVFVILRELEDLLELGSHAYFIRMYIDQESRHIASTNKLFRVFLQGFDRALEKRDHRAKVLLAENINPGLQKASMRRYFARLGFQMLGRNQLGGEVWCKKLQTRFRF